MQLHGEGVTSPGCLCYRGPGWPPAWCWVSSLPAWGALVPPDQAVLMPSDQRAPNTVFIYSEVRCWLSQHPGE